MKFGFCTAELSSVKKIKNAGFDYAEVSVKDILIPLKPKQIWKKNKAKIKKLNFPADAANSFLNIKITGNNLDDNLISAYLKNAFSRAKELGVKIIVFGSGKARYIPAGFARKKAVSQFHDFMSKALAWAEKTNITIALEPLNKKETNFINTIDEAGKIIKNINNPYLKLAADFYHIMEEKDRLENLYEYKEELVHIHISDSERRLPGFGKYDFGKLIEVLRKIGYNSRISFECNYVGQ